MHVPLISALRRALKAAATAPGLAVLLLAAGLPALFLSSAGQAAAQPRLQLTAAQADQVLTWTADDSMTAYKSTPTTATAGPATIVFENSVATGNVTGMTHTLTFDVSTPGYNHDVRVNILASPIDANGGRHEVQVNLTPGKYRFFCAIPGHGQMVGELVVTDGGGSDTTAPQVSAQVAGDQDENGAYVGSATVTVSASDTESGVETVEYALDDAAFAPYTAPVTVNEVGAHTVRYRATDAAGNTSEVGSVAFTVVAPQEEDTTAPQVTAEVAGDRNDDGDYVGSATVTITATDAQSGVDTVEYSLNGQPYALYAQPVTVAQPGAHVVTYRATDKAGNTSDAGTTEFTVVAEQEEDTTPPQVTAQVAGDRNENGEYVGSATVTVTATDTESGVDTVEYSLDNAAFAAYTAPVTVNRAGAHTVRYRATDEAGNTSEVGSVTFTVVVPQGEDTTPPQVTAGITGSMDWAWNYVGSATVTITATDADSGVETVEYSLDGQPYAVYTKALAVTQPGAHTVTYRATDKAGNTSAVGTARFMVVKAAPGGDGPPGEECPKPGKGKGKDCKKP
ncbi:OmpL47-type beta-barrel domain-containing protein [Nonomuraea aridisoli]|uniref:OmpL47-type beta-barrel domain-containing protein n=1 Tax=Nonomuraea aridisoli TaxID=2070368 RepID=UPI000DA93E4F|nr:plastocyanin/azurin family copper-binding protein [Nonomuraea aridisoli]